MTLYFQDSTQRRFTVSVPNVEDTLWHLLLSGEYPHKLEPKDVVEPAPWNQLDLSVVETNDRYTTFQVSNNIYYRTIRDNFYNGIYNIKIGKEIGQTGEEYIYEGTVKLITQASQDASRNIKKYESDDESNSGYVFYSQNL